MARVVLFRVQAAESTEAVESANAATMANAPTVSWLTEWMRRDAFEAHGVTDTHGVGTVFSLF